MKTYAINEVFNTIQGEGSHAGQRAVFVRFAGCNMWDGIAEHRQTARGVCGLWCDTDFRPRETLTAEALLAAIEKLWPLKDSQDSDRYCVLTGGEPGLQVERALLIALHDAYWRIGIETNGTIDLDDELFDWITVSPKRPRESEAVSPWKLKRADEVKIVLPGAAPGQPGWATEELVLMPEMFNARRCYVQPQDPIDPRQIEFSYLKNARQSVDMELAWEQNVQRCLTFVMAHPEWRIGIQLHKLIGQR